MAKVAGWMRSNIGFYLDNATAKRDYRAQLRGNRAIILWTLYLFLLIGIGMLNYLDSASADRMSVVEAQRTLQGFYEVVMVILGAMVALVAPALAATTIVVERERRSLDLIFSAPVKPKALLVGKMISAYRYTWMLLVLSLPVTAVCVVLGGATWSEVLAAYALLSLHAMLFSAIALSLSVLSNKPVAAIIWTYVAVGIYSSISGMVAFDSLVPGFMRGTTNEVPFYITFSPFSVVQAAGTYTTLFGMHVPNWIFFGMYVLFMTRLLLLGSASALSTFNSPETKNFRITGLVTDALLSFGIAYLSLDTYRTVSRYSGSPYPGAYTPPTVNTDHVCATVTAVVPMLLAFLLPFIVCSGSDGEKKFWPNGWFSFREAFRGTPAGALPYILMFVGISTASVVAAYYMMFGKMPGEFVLATVVWNAGFWTFCWSLGRYASAAANELRSARTLHLAALIVLFGLPVPFLYIIDPEQQTVLWQAYPLYPLFMEASSGSSPRVLMGIVLLGVGTLITYAATQRAKKKSALPPVIPPMAPVTAPPVMS